ncbi:hypothetical protein MKW98_030199, partial [Papaver atlanticum]
MGWTMSKTVTLKSSDGDTFEVEGAVVLQSQTSNNVIPLPKVTSKILAKVVEYCKKHVDSPKGEDDGDTEKELLKTWDAEFVK